MLNSRIDANESDYRQGDPGDANDDANENGSHWGHRPRDGTGMGANPSIYSPEIDADASAAVGIPIFKNNFSLEILIEP